MIPQPLQTETMADIDIYTSEAELDELKNVVFKYGRKTVVPKGGLFTQVGVLCDEIAYIKEGSFKYAKRNSKGKERILSFAFEGEFIGNYAASRNHNPALLNIQAMEESVILRISLEEYLSFFQKTIDGHTYIRKFVEVIAFQHLQKVISLACETPEWRYFQLQKKVPNVFNRVNLKDIASYLGVAPETLSRMRTSYLNSEKEPGS